MKFPIYLLLFFAFPFCTSAQKVALFSFDIGVTASENFYLTQDQRDIFLNNLPVLNNSTFKKANYNLALHYERNIVKNIFLKAGIELASHGYKLERREGIRWPDEYDGNGGFQLNPDYIHEFTPKINELSLIVPLSLRYEIPIGTLTPYVEGGFAVGVKTFRSTNSITETEIKVNRTSIWNEFASFANIGIGINYQHTEKMIFYLQPTAQWELIDTQEVGPHEYFYSLGARLGTRLTL